MEGSLQDARDSAPSSPGRLPRSPPPLTRSFGNVCLLGFRKSNTKSSVPCSRCRLLRRVPLSPSAPRPQSLRDHCPPARTHAKPSRPAVSPHRAPNGLQARLGPSGAICSRVRSLGLPSRGSSSLMGASLRDQSFLPFLSQLPLRSPQLTIPEHTPALNPCPPPGEFLKTPHFSTFDLTK